MKTHPRGTVVEDGSSWLNSHFPSNEFIPSIPSFHSGNPNPFATVGGRASGNEAAEKKDIFKVG